MLEPTPPTPFVDGSPAFGTYRGACDSTNLRARERGVGPVGQFLREKRWQWFSAADDALAVGGAIVDAGPLGSVFCWVVDRRREELVVDASRLVPSPALTLSDVPGSGDVASVRFGRRPLTVAREGSSVAVRGAVADLELDLELESPPAGAVTAICPVDGGPQAALNVTQKELAGRASGTVVVDDDEHTVTDGVGLLDYTHGLLGRETRWKWGFCVGVDEDGTPFGFNLVSGHNDGLENVIWHDGEQRALGAATVERPGEGDASRDEWRITTDDGVVDARLAVEAERVANTNLGVVASQYRQPVGRWSGRIGDREVDGAYGVAEDHRAKW